MNGPAPTIASRPIVILGAAGMLGTAWTRLLAREKVHHIALTREQIDLSRPGTLTYLETLAPAAVINCAGFTRVDDAETREDQARAVNAQGAAAAAATCARLDVPLIHYSTDYVFDGTASEPYRADAATAPINAYGRTKLEGERLVAAAHPGALVIRTSWLYAPWGSNFVRTIAAKAREHPTLRVVTDQRGRPTSAEHLALGSLRLLRKGVTGLHHLTDEGEATWFDFARAIVRLTGARCVVEPCVSSEFPRPARRPAYSVLDLSQTIDSIGPLVQWNDALAQVISSIASSQAPGLAKGPDS